MAQASRNAAASGTAPFLPGITAKDEYPLGCVDCHKNEGRDRTVASVLGKAKDHPNVAKLVKTVPTDCTMCHKAGTKVPELNLVIHTVHFRELATNPFVTSYGGVCLTCHAYSVTGGNDGEERPEELVACPG